MDIGIIKIIAAIVLSLHVLPVFAMFLGLVLKGLDTQLMKHLYVYGWRLNVYILIAVILFTSFLLSIQWLLTS